MKKDLHLKLLFIFALALIFRFLFFPNNVYFGFDQARDSYTSLEILKGNLKLVGPPSSADDRIFHGPLIYYIYAPVYFLSNHSPEAVAFLFRVLNASCIFLVFLIASCIFGKRVGLISALLFAVSFEQTQYSLFLSHPSLAVLGVLLYYFGLSLAIFEKNQKGLLLVGIGLGLSIQFHYVNALLLFGLTIYLIFFRKSISASKKIITTSLLCFLLIISTFIISELKFNFRGTKGFFEILIKSLYPTDQINHVDSLGIAGVLKRLIHDNFILAENHIILFSTVLGIIFIFLFFKKKVRAKLFFLAVWLFCGLIAYMISKSPSYYHNPAASVSLIIFVSYIISQVWQKNILFGLTFILIIFFNNLSLIKSINQKGPNADIVIQPQMLTYFEKQAIDYCYQESGNQVFSINSLTIPLYINTTWSYLLEWYGLQTYHYLPIWGGKLASGFYNNLPIETKRSKLPINQCLIIEPTVGISENDKSNFLREEDYFSKVVKIQKFGPIITQYRQKI